MANTLRVGILGGGPVTQAIHLPVLAGMADLWRIVAVMDPNPVVATEVAARCGAKACGEAAEIIEDPTIDVVAICSPNAFHADQIIAACAAGKRAVLCEKPLAVSREQAAAIAEAATASGTVVFVGTMHQYDPGYGWASERWMQLGETASSVKSAIYLPPNGLFVGLATDEAIPAGGPPPPVVNPSPDQQREKLRQTILGLAIHHIPLVRRFYPEVGEVIAARSIPPFGYSILSKNGDQVLEMLAFMPGQWPPSWTFEVNGGATDVHLDFPPSYVMAGSGRATLRQGDVSASFSSRDNGYQIQWRRLHEVVEAGQPTTSLTDAIADFEFALDLADRAMAVMEIAQ